MKEGGPNFEETKLIDRVDELEGKAHTLADDVEINLQDINLRASQLAGTTDGRARLLRILRSIDALRSSAGHFFHKMNFGTVEHTARQLFPQEK
jgi:hypothetical protein